MDQDPTRVDHLWQRMYRHGFWRGGEAVLSAVSAAEARPPSRRCARPSATTSS
jgi:hypothetical protein